MSCACDYPENSTNPSRFVFLNENKPPQHKGTLLHIYTMRTQLYMSVTANHLLHNNNNGDNILAFLRETRNLRYYIL